MSLPTVPGLISDLIDWDSAPDPTNDPEDQPDRLCELWVAWNAVGEERDPAKREVLLGELSGVLTTYLLSNRLPSEVWGDRGEPESWVQINDVIADLDEETRDEWHQEIDDAIDEVRRDAAKADGPAGGGA